MSETRETIVPAAPGFWVRSGELYGDENRLGHVVQPVVAWRVTERRHRGQWELMANGEPIVVDEAEGYPEVRPAPSWPHFERVIYSPGAEPRAEADSEEEAARTKAEIEGLWRREEEAARAQAAARDEAESKRRAASNPAAVPAERTCQECGTGFWDRSRQRDHEAGGCAKRRAEAAAA